MTVEAKVARIKHCRKKPKPLPLHSQNFTNARQETRALQQTAVPVHTMISFYSPEMVATINTTIECGLMPNVMVALPNIGGALCSTPQSLADAHYLTVVQ